MAVHWVPVSLVPTRPRRPAPRRGRTVGRPGFEILTRGRYMRSGLGSSSSRDETMARASLKVVTLTEAAAERVKGIMARSEKPLAGLRVGVKNGGCAGMSYTMEYADAVAPHDEVVEDKGVTILIDPKAVLFLLGTQMDFQTSKMSSGFTFSNPNQTSACGCGESVAITPATPETVAASA